MNKTSEVYRNNIKRSIDCSDSTNANLHRLNVFVNFFLLLLHGDKIFIQPYY